MISHPKKLHTQPPSKKGKKTNGKAILPPLFTYIYGLLPLFNHNPKHSKKKSKKKPQRPQCQKKP
jgi:hypothetical protein